MAMVCGLRMRSSSACGYTARIVAKSCVTSALWLPMAGSRGNTNLQCGDRIVAAHMKTLQGKIALVTGAASGIGRASAMLFASEGAAVVALDRDAEVEATAAAIRSAGGRATALIRDSSAETDIAGAVALAVKDYGGLDVCYANAGISGGLVPFFEETVERWTEVLKINLIGTFLAVKYSALAMVERKRGSII